MNPEHFRRVEQLYHSARELEPAQREAFLAGVCRGDEALRHEVEALLAQDALTGPMERSPVEVAANLLGDATVTQVAVGTQLGLYRIETLLGAGGMGEVYQAHDTNLGRDVALKVLPGRFVSDPERLARFRREARMLAALNHPNIATIHGLEQADGVHYLVMELVAGETLAERVQKGPLAIEDALKISVQITEALEAAHEKGIVHRDLKPANVKVTPEGRVKVLDFGLAKAFASEGEVNLSQVSTVSQEGRIVGTPGYMSPEQARGKPADKRTDIWAFGCVVYELLAGKRAFRGETLAETIQAILEREPDWSALPAKTPRQITELLKRCLHKDVNRRVQKITDARTVIEKAQKETNHWQLAAVGAGVVALLAVGAALWLRGPAPSPSRDQWVQLTKLPDSVSQPALSPDGRMLAFIRGPRTFFGPGQVYVKILPDGEPQQLTNDSLRKMSPTFSPDGARIAYTTVDIQFHWDVWTVPVLGGQPQLWLRNASGLVWSGPNQLLFSEFKQPPHMGIVAAEESRLDERQVYLPADERGMAHRSYASPDGKWVLLVEMDGDGRWMPCRLVPKDGSSPGRQVGPAGRGCTSGAWSRDGKWMYLTSDAGGANHVWRQRFPDGQPKQFTSGPTEEEGVAVAPDGGSFVTAVGVRNSALWLHDGKGERQISLLEGSAETPEFTPDGKKLCYMVYKSAPEFASANFPPGELWVADLESGRSERLFPGLQILTYDVSPDSQQVVMEAADRERRHRLWLAPLDRSSAPRQIPNVEGSRPLASDGDVFFLHAEGDSSFVYRVRPDGTGMRKAIDRPISRLYSFTPNGRRLVAWAPASDGGSVIWQAFQLDGGSPILIAGNILGGWTKGGNSVSFFDRGTGRSYIVPIPSGEDFPRLPEGGLQSEEQIASLPGAQRVDANSVVPGVSPGVYLFLRVATQRNLFRIPIP